MRSWEALTPSPLTTPPPENFRNGRCPAENAFISALAWTMATPFRWRIMVRAISDTSEHLVTRLFLKLHPEFREEKREVFHNIVKLSKTRTVNCNFQTSNFHLKLSKSICPVNHTFFTLTTDFGTVSFWQHYFHTNCNNKLNNVTIIHDYWLLIHIRLY